jgi:glucose/arabinose dehydrogenase
MKYIKILAVILALLIAAGVFVKYYFHVNPPIQFTSQHSLGSLPLDRLSLPPGFTVNLFAEGLEDARSMALSPSGTLFVGTKSAGKVYALKDLDGDMRADTVYTLLTGANMPNGVAFHDGSLYIAEVNRILRFRNIEQSLLKPGIPDTIYNQFPEEKHHGWKYIAFGPDGKLYVPVGAPCNICLSDDPVFASLTRMNPDGSGFEIVQNGIRNTVGFDWHPVTRQLWFTDNGRDLLGDDMPACELNHAPNDGMHFGYPYCHQGDLPDPEFGSKKPCTAFTPPAALMGPHTAPLGMQFYTGSNFPGEYQNQIFVARHGSWNRSRKSGYDVSLVQLDSIGKVRKVSPFISGWLDPNTDDVWGRPVDIEQMPDGSILVSDDFANAIYRIVYSK